MAESSNRGRKHQAFQAMLALGFDWVDIHVALEDLLQFYEYKWDHIEANNYYQLLDWILNRRPSVPVHGSQLMDAYEHWGEEIQKPASSELVRFQELKPLLIPSEKPGLAKDKGPRDQGNPPSPGAGVQSATISSTESDLNISPIARLQAMSPMLMPLEKTMQVLESNSANGTRQRSGDKAHLLRSKNEKVFPIDLDINPEFPPKRVKFLDEVELSVEIPSVSQVLAHTDHLLSTPDPSPSPSHVGSSAGETSVQPSSPHSVLQGLVCTGPTYDQLSSSEIARRRLTSDPERSGAEVEKGKQISEDSELGRGEAEDTSEVFKYYLDPRYVESPKGNNFLRDLVDSRNKLSSLDMSVIEPKVTTEYLSDMLISTRTTLGEESFMQSETSDGKVTVSRTSYCKPVELDTIHLLVKEMTHEYFTLMSVASNVSSCSSSETTSNLDSPLEGPEGLP